jgi:hypothetical protein
LFHVIVVTARHLPDGYDSAAYPDGWLRVGLPSENAVHRRGCHCANYYGTRRLAGAVQGRVSKLDESEFCTSGCVCSLANPFVAVTAEPRVHRHQLDDIRYPEGSARRRKDRIIKCSLQLTAMARAAFVTRWRSAKVHSLCWMFSFAKMNSTCHYPSSGCTWLP